MEPVDLYPTYRLVSQREKRAREEEDKALALAAKMVARQLLEEPSVTHLNAFRLAERRWLFYRGVRRNADCLYSVFKAAIDSGNFVVNRPPYRNKALGDDPESGFVYCLTSSDYPEHVKIGYTKNAPEQRLRQILFRKQLSDATLEYVMAVEHPARVESAAHKLLNAYRLSVGVEWFSRPVGAAAFVIAHAAYLCNCDVQYIRTFGKSMPGQQGLVRLD